MDVVAPYNLVKSTSWNNGFLYRKGDKRGVGNLKLAELLWIRLLLLGDFCQGNTLAGNVAISDKLSNIMGIQSCTEIISTVGVHGLELPEAEGS